MIIYIQKDKLIEKIYNMTLVNIPSGMLVECGVDECCTITRTFKPIEKFTGIFKCHECRGMAGYDTCVSCGALCKWKQDEFEDVVGHTCHMCVKELYKNHPEKMFLVPVHTCGPVSGVGKALLENNNM